MRHLPIAAAIAVAALPGCARALREPPPLAVLGDASAHGSTDGPAEVDDLLARARALYATRTLDDVREASTIWLRAARADGTRVEGLVGAARAGAWLVDHERDPEARREAAVTAVDAAQWCARIAPADPACSYWLGAALGMQARERRSTGLDALPRIEEAFKAAAAAAPAMEHAGPDRALALLYVRAPGWPSGPGDPDLGLDHARRAVAIDPAWPPNHLALGEALAATGDPEGARESYRRAMALAREMANGGDPDAPEWAAEAEGAIAGPAGGG